MTKSKGITPVVIYPMRVKKRIVFVEEKGRDAVPLPALNRPLNDYEITILKRLFKQYSDDVRNRLKKSKLMYRDGLHIDHKISVHSCFWNNVSIDDASDISNLRLIPSYENRTKFTKDYIDDYNRWIAEKYNIKRKGIYLRLYDAEM